MDSESSKQSFFSSPIVLRAERPANPVCIAHSLPNGGNVVKDTAVIGDSFPRRPGAASLMLPYISSSTRAFAKATIIGFSIMRCFTLCLLAIFCDRATIHVVKMMIRDNEKNDGNDS